jgi:hypothetical protein
VPAFTKSEVVMPVTASDIVIENEIAFKVFVGVVCVVVKVEIAGPFGYVTRAYPIPVRPVIVPPAGFGITAFPAVNVVVVTPPM